MLTFGVVLVLALGVFGQRAAGALLVDADRLGDRSRAVLSALPLTIISAVIALAALTDDGDVVTDARVAGVAVAGLCAWRKLPMFVTVVAAAVATATVRALT